LAGSGVSRSVTHVKGPNQHHRTLKPHRRHPFRWLVFLLLAYDLYAHTLGHLPSWLLVLTGLWCWWLWYRASPLVLQALVLLQRSLTGIGLLRERTWARPLDLLPLWVPGPTPGRPYLGWIGSAPRRMLAAEPEIQTLLVAPPRAGKSSGFIIPWLLDHTGPALVSSTKRDIYEATIAYRQGLGRVWVYDPFGEQSCSFSPLSAASTWEGALRVSTALASAAHPEQENSAGEFWDREASMLIAPLLHAATLQQQHIATVLQWLDTRDFTPAEEQLEQAKAYAAAAQLRGVLARDPRNRETTVMSATNLLRAYRYPRVAQSTPDELTPAAFLDGNANTIYIVAAAHHQEDLQPIILALVCSIYEAAIDASRQHGPLDPPLRLLLDEAANIAPVKDLAPWLSQCGDHGITIATSWQSVAQIEERYGQPGRNAILAASTAQIFLPPLADPTTTSYITTLLGEEPVTHISHTPQHQPLSVRRTGSGESASTQISPTPTNFSLARTQKTYNVTERPIATPQWLRQTQPGKALLVYRHLPPAITHAPRWFEDSRYVAYASYIADTHFLKRGFETPY
jgi:type IV secretion system protein VirD4